MTRQACTLTSSRHPASYGAFAACAFTGAWALVVPGGQSNVVDDALGHRFSALYYAALLVFGVMGLLALSLSPLERRLRAERCAWYVGWFAIAYTIAAFSLVGPRAGQAAIFVGALSPIATWRILQITIELRRWRHDQAAGLLADPPPLGRDNRPGTRA